MVLTAWEIVAICLAFCTVLVAMSIVGCRVMGVWNVNIPSIWKAKLFDRGEESHVLTKHEKPVGYMVMADSDQDFLINKSGEYVRYDTIQRDKHYMAMTGSDDIPRDPAQSVNEPPKYNISSPVDPSPVEPLPDDQPSPGSISGSSLEYEPTSNLQRAVSCESVASDSSVMELQPELPKIGQLEFGLEYDRESLEIIVSIIQAKDLTPNEFTGTIDTYVKVYISPELSEAKFTTKVQKGTTNPEYIERFKTELDPIDLNKTNIQFHLYSMDKYARHKVVGEVDMCLGDVDLVHPVRMWMNLRGVDEKPADFGGIMFSLSYLPTAERLTVVVVKARGLKYTDERTLGDCFVKVYLLQKNKKISKKKTNLKCGDKMPIFNEAMIFSVPSPTLKNVQIRLSVVEKSSDGRLTSLGHVIVGAHCFGSALSHWNQMIQSLRKPVSMWHDLRRQGQRQTHCD
ncbi:unnamed protein product [Owenia fusiformis]|uniref:Uncharacterized protein n=1 Tax=Owenia fusiformis TaxID=6347 RepID=A0A8J1XST2_OWEFU|nr:unnamed protein product [Owenia fusiformis]